jgi:hypothetical protein
VGSISNKERGRPPKRMPSLEKPSPTTIACFKIETACTHVTPLTLFAYKNVHKIERRGPPMPFAPHAMLAH